MGSREHAPRVHAVHHHVLLRRVLRSEAERAPVVQGHAAGGGRSSGRGLRGHGCGGRCGRPPGAVRGLRRAVRRGLRHRLQHRYRHGERVVPRPRGLLVGRPHDGLRNRRPGVGYGGGRLHRGGGMEGGVRRPGRAHRARAGCDDARSPAAAPGPGRSCRGRGSWRGDRAGSACFRLGSRARRGSTCAFPPRLRRCSGCTAYGRRAPSARGS